MTVSAGYLIYLCIQVLFCIGVGFVLGWFLGRQDLEIKQRRTRDAKWDRDHPA